MKHLNSLVKKGRIHLKELPSANVNQMDHYIIPMLEEFDYDCARIHSGIKDIFRSKNMSEDLPKKIIQIGTIFQRYNIGKVYVSSILPSTRTLFKIKLMKS